METSTDEELDKILKECSSLRKTIKRLELELEEAKAKHVAATNKAASLRKRKIGKENRSKIDKVNSSLHHDWVDKDFEWSKRLNKVLKEIFGFDSFRPQQLAAINATLSKKDVILVMPTGGGKSLVYQLPALIDSGFSLIISPLISLIEDQLHALKSFKINAATVNSSIPKDECNRVYAEMKDNKSDLKLVYVTPEWVAKSKRFMALLTKCYELKRISRVAIDEVHCCSTWGHDFRPDYDFLGLLRASLSNVPFLGLTATATMAVLTDVQSMLGMENSMIITAPFNRPNLFYKVVPKPVTKPEVIDYLEKLLKEQYKDETGIIYTNTINESVNLASELKNKGLSVAPYHAQLEAKHRTSIHKKWIQKTYQVVIATVAFGMGIDVPDVRFVIHHTIPKSMESLYQESGRAGRDGKKADCIVLFSLNDYFKVLGMASSINDEKKATAALEYCLDQIRCRRSLIATHFEEVWDRNDCNKMCDHCNRENIQLIYYDITSACSDIHSIIDQATTTGDKLTLIKLLDSWFQTGAKKLRITGLKAPKISKRDAEIIVSYLIAKQYLSIDKGYTNYTTICYLTKGKPLNGDKIEMLTSHIYLGFPKRYLESHESGEPSKKKSKM